MKNKKIIILGVVLLLAFAVGGFFLYQYLINNKPLKEAWGQKYYVYLQESTKYEQESTIPKDAKKTKIKFVETKQSKDPAMVISYEIKEETYTNVYTINEDKVNSYVYEQPTTLELLYNIEKDEYNYYLHVVKEKEDSFNSLDNEFGQEEYVLTKDEEGNLANYDDLFIEVDVTDNFSDLTLEKDLKMEIENAIDTFTTKEKIITADVKTKVSEQLKENETKKMEATYNKLIGVWYNKADNIIVEFSNDNNKKEYMYGIFASEIAYNGEVEEPTFADNIYTFKMDKQTYNVDMTDIGNKKIKINNKSFVYVHKDFSKAGDIIFEKYFY